MSKKKKIIVLCGMVALLVVTGVLNIVLNTTGSSPVEGGGGGDTRSLFQIYRADRAATREGDMLYLDALIANENTSAATRAAAEAQKLYITELSRVELALEQLVRAIGFEDAFITMSTNNVNVIVRASSLNEDEANRILAVIQDETGRSARQVTVMHLDRNR